MKTIALLTIATANLAIADINWPEFRGPRGDGATTATGLAVEMGEEKNVKWKTPIAGKAWSSPVVWGKQVWVTTATENGKELGVVQLDLDTGKVVRDQKLFDVAEPQFCHKFNSYGSPTPAIEEGRIYVSFGSPGIAALDTATGKVLWERRDFVCNHFRGAGSSPILWKNLIILPFDGSDFQFIVALDKATGKTVWKVDRSIDFKDIQPDGKPEAEGDWRKGFATAHVTELAGKSILISSGAKAHYGYEPASGKELWRFEERGAHSAAARPVVAGDVAYFPIGFGKKQVIALKLNGSGPLDESAVVWRSPKSAPTKPSVCHDGKRVYVVDDAGVAGAIDPKTGADIWRERIGGNYSASPLLAEGRIYYFSEEGKVTVVAASDKFEKIAEGKFTEGFMASPAVSGKAMILRTKAAVYRIEK
jgi:outer membrane protein assembly factor BamB